MVSAPQHHRRPGRGRGSCGAELSERTFFGFIVPSDFDLDEDVDGDDLKIFVACVSGPAVSYDAAQLPPSCAVTPTGQTIPPDFDKDADVDQDDFGIFQRCYSGIGKPADPNCTE